MEHSKHSTAGKYKRNGKIIYSGSGNTRQVERFNKEKYSKLALRQVNLTWPRDGLTIVDFELEPTKTHQYLLSDKHMRVLNCINSLDHTALLWTTHTVNFILLFLLLPHTFTDTRT